MPARRNPANHQSPATQIRQVLLAWLKRHARRLPWRPPRSPYAVWVSEVMLQQTQVATVIPYFNRFIKAFPTVEKLAAAPLERVLEMWSGLGYYRRARMMHQAARAMLQRFSGRFPADYDQARTLPGVGDYTARAVLSIAYNQPRAVLDGNVARVIARLRARRGNLHQGRFRRAVEQDLEELLSRRRPGDFNQALMELGQRVCRPRAPLCLRCPLERYCQAHRIGRAEAFTEPRPRKEPELHHLAAAVIRRGDKVAMVRGLDDGLLSDLWNFPAAFGRSRHHARIVLEQKLAKVFRSNIRLGRRMGQITHNITHRAIRADIYKMELAGNGRPTPRNVDAQAKAGKTPGCPVRWLDLPRLHDAAASRLAKKIAATAWP